MGSGAEYVVMIGFFFNWVIRLPEREGTGQEWRP